MELTVFYAWQSDTHQKANHYLIRDALDDAIRALNADVKVDEPIRLDHDTKGKTGTPHVADTILEKIRDCSIFIADVTCVGKTISRIVSGKRRRKRMPNPNVMLEVGYASALIPWDQIIFIMNTAFGAPKYLPFDLKFRRFPIQYNLPSTSDQSPDAVLAKHHKAKLADVFKKAIGDIIAGGVVNRRADQEALAAKALRKAREGEVAKEREEFEYKLLHDAYYNFKSQVAVMAATIIPLFPPKEPVTFNDEVMLMRHFQPPGISGGCQVRHRPKSIMLAESDDRVLYNVAELTTDGRVFMARNLAYGRDAIGPNFAEKIDPAKRWLMSMETYQWQFVDAVRRYLKGLVAFGISGPWFFTLSMLKMRNGILVPTYESFFFRELGTPSTDENMYADTILIPADLDPNSEDAVMSELKQPLREIWRHNGHKGLPVFSDKGFRWE
jgi:hypothetical protein